MKLKKEIDVEIEVNPLELGASFSGWDSVEQCDFFTGLSDEAIKFNWCRQACYIADDLIKKGKHKEVRECLIAIVEHIDLAVKDNQK